MTDEPTFDLRSLAIPAYGPSFLFGIGDGAILPVIVLTARDLGATVAVAALVVMLIDLGSLIFNVPASILTARYGERHVITGAAVVGVLAALLCALAPGLLAFGAGVLVMGFSASVFMLARQSYLTEAVPAQFRARALSTLGGVMRVGVFIGPFVGAAAIHVFGLSAAYVVCAGALALAGLLSTRMPDLPAHPHLAQARAEVTVRTVLRDHRRVFLTVGIGILLVALVRAARQTVIPLWADDIGLSPQATSVIFGIAGGIDMLVFYPAGKVMDLKGRRWVTVPSMLVMGTALLLMPLTTGAVSLTAVSCLLGFGNGIGSGMVMTLGADFSPDVGRAQFLGIWRELSDIGGTSGPLLLSALTATISLGAGVVACGLVGFIAAAVLYRAVPSRRNAKV